VCVVSGSSSTGTLWNSPSLCQSFTYENMSQGSLYIHSISFLLSSLFPLSAVCRCVMLLLCTLVSKYVKHQCQYKKTSNVLVTLMETTEDCLKKLFKAVGTTRRISELVRQ